MDNDNKQKSLMIPRASAKEKAARLQLLQLFENTPIPRTELLDNLTLFIRPQLISSVLMLHELYRHILEVQGVIIEFGVRWGRNLTLFTALRDIYEPHNFYRKIVGFDTFSGFPRISNKDGLAEVIKEGAFGVTPDYDQYLQALLEYHEEESSLSHIRKFEIRKGDAPHELEKYLNEYPETVIALAYFDLDLYEPTKRCLEIIEPCLTKGSVVAFDEVMHREFPGETIALKEVMGVRGLKLQRNPFHPAPSYIIIE